MLKRTSINADELQFQVEQQCLRQDLPEALGAGYSNIFQLDDHLTFIETRYTPSKDLAIISRMDLQEPRMVVTLSLTGQSRFSGKTGKELIFTEGYTSITTFNSSMGERQYVAELNVAQLRFSISKQWVDKYFGAHKCNHLFNPSGIKQVSCHPTSHQGLVAAKQLLACQVSKELRPIFMHGQAMSILAAELAVLCEDQSKSTGRFNQKDQEMVLLARDILLQEYRIPPSVEQLSIRVGTNQFKLKQLFHHFFNTTPYGLLSDIRMNKAYELLENRSCHVSVAADLVGYQYASNFSNAFIKHFGISPKAVSKK